MSYMLNVKKVNPTRLLISPIIVIVFTTQTACASVSPATGQLKKSPVIESINYMHDTFANSDVQIDCLAKDVDGDNLTYRWTAEEGRISGNGPNVVWTPPDRMGTYNVTLSVYDGKGGTASENISIRVVTNADGTATPMVELKLKLGDSEPEVVSKQRVRIWMTTDIICLVENPGGGDLTYSWSASAGKMQGKGLEEGKADKIRWVAPGQRGEAAVNVKVRDSLGREARGRVDIEIFCCGN
jgi:hypothetical protein